ncbi:4Fe-4S dicluster domain-containing protein, partial [Candidatus Moduliflexota bacterium]
MKRTEGIQFWRRRVHLLLFLAFAGLPFLRIRGESALRFDLHKLQLHFFGTAVWMDEFFLVLLLILFATFLFIWITLMYGRIWCGWMCPQVVLAGLAAAAAGKKGGKGERHGVSYGRALILAVVTGAVVLWYFISPYEFFRALAGGSLGRTAAAAWLSLSLLVWLDLVLVRYTFCATVCPYSKLQGVMFDRNTLVIAYDRRRAAECIDCGACVRTCPVKIDIRDGLQAPCVNCAECIDACALVLGRKGKTSLVGYFFGTPGGKSRPWRPASVVAAAAAGLFLLSLLAAAALMRSSVDFTAHPSPELRARRSATGAIVGSFEIAIRNRRRERAHFSLSAESASGQVRVSPSETAVDAGG